MLRHAIAACVTCGLLAAASAAASRPFTYTPDEPGSRFDIDCLARIGGERGRLDEVIVAPGAGT